MQLKRPVFTERGAVYNPWLNGEIDVYDIHDDDNSTLGGGHNTQNVLFAFLKSHSRN